MYSVPLNFFDQNCKSNAVIYHLINNFGNQNGFSYLLNRFKQRDIPLSRMLAYMNPFKLCAKVFSEEAVETYLLPIVKIVPDVILGLSNDEIKKQVKNGFRMEDLMVIFQNLQLFSSCSPTEASNKILKSLELFRLRVLLRFLNVPSISIKMASLNELNKLMARHNISGSSMLHRNVNRDCLSGREIACFLIENDVLAIILKDCLHQPQYVEKLDSLIRFLINHECLSNDHLDKIWNTQIGKHEVIVNNLHNLITRLAWTFTSNHLDHLFDCLKSSWIDVSKKEKEKFLELMIKLTEDDKDGALAQKVSDLLWNLALNNETDIETFEQALAAHLKILDYRKTNNQKQKIFWLKRCVYMLKDADCQWPVLLLNHFRNICSLFPVKMVPANRELCRNELIRHFQSKFSLISTVIENLKTYLEEFRNSVSELTDFNEDVQLWHSREIQERLNFLRFILQDGRLWLHLEDANLIWECLVCNFVLDSDRSICFRWFTALMSGQSDINPTIYKPFFNRNILKLNPALVDVWGVQCFECFFTAVNLAEGKLIQRNGYFLQRSNLNGIEYLWKLIQYSCDDASAKAISFLQRTFTSLGPDLVRSQDAIHIDFIKSCNEKLKASFHALSAMLDDHSHQDRVNSELNKMFRIVSTLYEYITKCDQTFVGQRSFVPMSQSYRGRPIVLNISVNSLGRETDNLKMSTHSNELMSAVRERVLRK